jgi:hypothetical protein
MTGIALFKMLAGSLVDSHKDYLKLKHTQYQSRLNTPTPMTHTEPDNLGLSEYIVLHLNFFSM